MDKGARVNSLSWLDALHSFPSAVSVHVKGYVGRRWSFTESIHCLSLGNRINSLASGLIRVNQF